MKRARLSKLNVYEEKILSIMRLYYEPMNINEIAYDSNIHWVTAQKWLNSLRQKGFIKVIKDSSGKLMWQAIREE